MTRVRVSQRLADDQVGLMDHLGIRQFFFGNCIGGSFALKLMERARTASSPAC
jgi:hypothetical protein